MTNADWFRRSSSQTHRAAPKPDKTCISLRRDLNLPQSVDSHFGELLKTVGASISVDDSRKLLIEAFQMSEATSKLYADPADLRKTVVAATKPAPKRVQSTLEQPKHVVDVVRTFGLHRQR